MCPSFRVTREEEHSTRGRAHLLWEMLNGDTIQGGWRSEEVKQSLDLCLSCKGCKSDCPVAVDVATYKAEFLSHYYHRRIRPIHAYAFGLIHTWARLASHFPRLVNFFGRAVPFSSIFKGVIGIAHERQVPEFAPEPFSKWFHKRERRCAANGERWYGTSRLCLCWKISWPGSRMTVVSSSWNLRRSGSGK